MRQQLRKGVGDRVGDKDLIRWVHEGIVEAHCPVRPLLLGIEVVNFFLVW